MDTQPQSADSLLMGIAAGNTQVNNTQESVAATPEVTPNIEVTPVEPVSLEPTPAKSEGTDPVQIDTKVIATGSETPIDDWDSDTPTQATEPAKSYDFSSLSKSLGSEFKSEDELVAEFKKLKEHNEELTKSSTDVKDLFANDVLQKANEIAKNNGDYLGFLGIASIDFDAIPARDLLEDELISSLPDTPENAQKIQSYLDSLDETDLEFRGSQIRNTRKSEQDYEKNRIAQENEMRKAQEVQAKQLMDKKVEELLSATTDINGFVMKPHHKKAIFEDITQGKLYNKLFFTDGKYDPAKAIRIAFIAEQNEKMIQYYKTRSKTEGKREVISSITNAELDRPGTVAPSAAPKSAMDLYMESLRSSK